MTNASTPEPASGTPGPAERLAGMLSPEAIDGLLAEAAQSPIAAYVRAPASTAQTATSRTDCRL